jgi:hypothetical protein
MHALTEKYYMNTFTGSVDTEEGWYPENINTLIEVIKDKNGQWINASEGVNHVPG